MITKLGICGFSYLEYKNLCLSYREELVLLSWTQSKEFNYRRDKAKQYKHEEKPKAKLDLMVIIQMIGIMSNVS
jgi:hypothetical protein